jgi:hypothetical protein
MKNILSVSVIVLTALGAILALGAVSVRAANPAHAAAGVCSADIRLPQNKEELSRFDVEHALRQLFARAGQTPTRIESRHAGEDIIAASVYLADGKRFWTVRIDSAEARVISSRYHLKAVGFGNPKKYSRGAGLRREISDTMRLRRHMLGDGQPWGDWVGSIKSTCADDYRNGAPEML